MAFYLRRRSKDFGDDAFRHLLEKDSWLQKLTSDFNELAGAEVVQYVRGLILWREVPEDVVFQMDDGSSPRSLRQYIKRTVCRAIQRDIVEDPLWKKDDSTRSDRAGGWTYYSDRKIEALLSFWEYYLLGELQCEVMARGVSRQAFNIWDTGQGRYVNKKSAWLKLD
jgi:hypothetical protein